MTEIIQKKKKERVARPSPIPQDKTVLEWLGLTAESFTQLIRENPSLRGMILGYTAEFQLRKMLSVDKRLKDIVKDDDHDRTAKGDLRFIYREQSFRLEVKSLQTNQTKMRPDGTASCIFQCDASDSRIVKFDDGSEVKTTSLVVGEFDVLAVNMFAVAGGWTFAFAKNSTLPRSTHKGYTETQQAKLLKTSMPISWPISAPYSSDLFSVLDAVIVERAAHQAPEAPHIEVSTELPLS